MVKPAHRVMPIARVKPQKRKPHCLFAFLITSGLNPLYISAFAHNKLKPHCYKKWIASGNVFAMMIKNNFAILNLVKTFLTSINFDSLSERNLYLIIKNYSKGVCKMKHTKNILKSLLIMVMALSLLEVSCSKDEGKPTSPQTTEVNAETITGILSAMFSMTVDNSEDALFASDITHANGVANIETATGKTIDTDIKTKLTTSIETITSTYASVVTLNSNVNSLSSSSKNLTLTMKPANANVKFASDVTDGKTYTYDAAKGEASLIITITEK